MLLIFFKKKYYFYYFGNSEVLGQVVKSELYLKVVLPQFFLQILGNFLE